MKSDKAELSKLIGQRITSIEIIKAEYGRTYGNYLCIVTELGEKVMLYGGIPYKPKPDPEEMKKAPNYFSVQDIANRVAEIEEKRRGNIKAEECRAREEYKRLKERFEVKP